MSQGSAFMANGQRSIRDAIDAATLREQRRQIALEKKRREAEERVVRLSEGGDFEGSVFRAKSGQKFPKLKLHNVEIPKPITAQRKIMPSHEVLGLRSFSAGPQKINPVIIK